MSLDPYFWIGLVALAPLFAAYVWLGLFPQKVGSIEAFGEVVDPDEPKGVCDRPLLERIPGKVGIPVLIKCIGGEMVEAEIAPCNICIEKLKIGDEVGITRIGGRTIAQPMLIPTWTKRRHKQRQEPKDRQDPDN